MKRDDPLTDLLNVWVLRHMRTPTERIRSATVRERIGRVWVTVKRKISAETLETMARTTALVILVMLVSASAIGGLVFLSGTAQAEDAGTGSVSGTVTNIGNDGIGGADVRLVESSSDQVVKTTTTTPEGEYSFDSVETGEYFVEAEFDGTTGRSVTTEVSDGVDSTANVVINVEDSGDTGGEEDTAPTADFTHSPSTPVTGETVSFDASDSSDSDGSVENYEWDFDGDGFTHIGETTIHSYDTQGDHTVTLKVTDDGGATNTTTRTVAVQEPDTGDGGDGSGDDGSGSGDGGDNSGDDTPDGKIDDTQTSTSDTDGDGLSDRVQVDVTVSDVGSGQTTVEIGGSNFGVNASPTDTTDGNQAQFVTQQDPDGDGTPEAVEFVAIGTADATYTVVADMSNQAEGGTGTVDIELGGGATSSTTFTVEEDSTGPLIPDNPFGDSSNNPVSRETVIGDVVEWNLGGSIEGTTYTRQEIINSVVEWNLAP